MLSNWQFTLPTKTVLAIWENANQNGFDIEPHPSYRDFYKRQMTTDVVEAVGKEDPVLQRGV